MQRLKSISRIGFFILAALLPTSLPARAEPLTIVTYDAGLEVWKALGRGYARQFAAAHPGETFEFNVSSGGSAKQAANVIAGFKADVVALALPVDLDAIAAAGLLDKRWRDRLPNHASAYTSTLVFVVRQGNPKHIANWPDLAKPGVQVITPSPKTGGGSKLNFLAPWGYVLQTGGDDARAQDLVARIYANVPVLDPGARGSATTFLNKGIGDVFVSWEAEARRAVAKESDNGRLELVRPGNTILARPPIAVVDKVADERGTREQAEGFTKWVFTHDGQEIIAATGWRPGDRAVLAEHAKEFPAPEKAWFEEEQFGPWEGIQKRFFDDGGVFDRIYKPQAK